MGFAYPDSFGLMTFVVAMFLAATTKQLRLPWLALATLVIVIMAQPYINRTAYRSVYKPTEIIGLIDDSGSMSETIRYPGGPTRSDAAVREFVAFKTWRPSHDKVGATLFNDTVRIAQPLAESDKRDFADRLKLSVSHYGETDMDSAFKSVIEQFDRTDGKNKRVLVILTDGDLFTRTYDHVHVTSELQRLGVSVYLLQLRQLGGISYGSSMLRTVVEFASGFDHIMEWHDQASLRAALLTIHEQERQETDIEQYETRNPIAIFPVILWFIISFWSSVRDAKQRCPEPRIDCC